MKEAISLFQSILNRLSLDFGPDEFELEDADIERDLQYGRGGYCQVSVVEARGGAVEDGRLQDSAGTRLLAPRAEGAISEHSVVG